MRMLQWGLGALLCGGDLGRGEVGGTRVSSGCCRERSWWLLGYSLMFG